MLRHAETAAPDVFHGYESDIGLSAKGYRQAELVAQVLQHHQPEVVVSSAMLRARETARHIAELVKAPHILEPLLHERKVGIYSGAKYTENNFWPETTKRWMAGEVTYAHEGAESYEEIRARILPVWNRVTEQHQGKRIAIVAHGVVCKVLLLSVLPGYSVADWNRLGSVRNVACTELLQNGAEWTALRLNELAAEIQELETGGSW